MLPSSLSSFLLFRARQARHFHVSVLWPHTHSEIHFRFDSSRFASLVFSVHPCQDFPLGHRGIISLVGYLGGEVGAARRPRKEAFNKEPRPCLPIGPAACTETARAICYRTSGRTSGRKPFPSPHLPAQSLGLWPLCGGEGGAPPTPGIDPELETSSSL